MQDNRMRLPVANPDPQNVTHIEVSVSYTKGGNNYWNGRGYYMIVTPIRIQGNMKGFTLGAGLKRLIEQVERLNKKRFELVKAQVEKKIRTRQGGVVIHTSYEAYKGPEQMYARNRWMVDHCDDLLALRNPEEKYSGTRQTMEYAFEKKMIWKAWEGWVQFITSKRGTNG